MVAPTSLRSTLCVAATLILAISASFAGEVILSWNPSEGATGYQIYRGTSSGQYLATDVGNTIETTASGLADCTTWYFAVTAYNGAGESGYSSEASSWPRAVLASANPAVVS